LKFIVVDELIRRIKEAFNKGIEFDLEKYMEADLLILDDLGAEKTTEFVEGEIYNIINYRYNNKLPTIITSNINWNDLESKYPMNGKRIASRISEMCGSFNLNGKDYRLKR
jgi:DNA replication protein DnaC